MQARTDQDFIAHEMRQAVHAEVYRDEALYCDRSHYRTDVCVATGGDVHVLGGTAHAAGSYQVLVFAEQGQERIEKLRPYTRKWEASVMETIDEVMVVKKVLLNGSSSSAQAPWPLGLNYTDPSPWLGSDLQKNTGVMVRLNQSANLHTTQNIKPQQMKANQMKGHRAPTHRKAALQEPSNYRSPKCEVQHEVPAILFSTGGYTGNVYHEFNDGLIPLFITAQQYSAGQVVLLALEFHNWWMSKYAEVVAQISNYTVINLARDKRVHCFPEVTVGLRIHDELAIHAENRDHASIEGFQSMLRAAYAPAALYKKAKQAAALRSGKATKTSKRPPKLVLISRRSPRALLNEREVIALAKEIGFSVEVLKPTRWTRMVDIYKVVSRCDVMVGVHGAAMTHLLFMRPGTTFIQVVPLGTDWAAATYYGEPAQKLGLNYIAYKVSPRESSLWHKYARDDPVLVSPESVNQKGWLETKRIYLDAQDVSVSLSRMRVTLLSAFDYK